jgi:hypothetical protein
MLQGGSFTLPPGHDLPIIAAALLGSVPEAATAIIDGDVSRLLFPDFSEIHPRCPLPPRSVAVLDAFPPSNSIGLLQLHLNGLDTGSDVRCGA